MVVLGSEAPVHIFRNRHSDSEIALDAQSDKQGRKSRVRRALTTAITVMGTASLLGLAACPADLEDPERFDVMGPGAAAGATGVAGSTGMAGAAAGTPPPACVVAVLTTCSISVCHKSGIGAAANLNLTPDNGLTGRLVDVAATHVDAAPTTGCPANAKYIDTADRGSSWLLQKLTKTKDQLGCGDPMPIGPALTADQLKCIQDYVMTATNGT